MKHLNWATLGLITVIMLPGGACKLLMMEEAPFAQLGLPVWVALLIGLVECAGAIGIWFSKTRRGAALGVAVIMVGAIYYHMQFPPEIGALPALLVLICAIFVLRRTGRTDA